MDKFRLTPGTLTLETISAFTRWRMPCELTGEALSQVQAAQQVVEQVLARGETVYGVNTGFGILADKAIAHDDLKKLQVNLIRSHSAGVGPLLDESIVRLVLLLKINSLSRGYSGVRPLVIDYLIRFLNEDLLPCLPGKGSVGASGDLAPLAHLSLALVGEGNVHLKRQLMPADRALQHVGLAPLELGPKEGLALVNGTQVSAAIAMEALFRTAVVFSAAIVAGAMSVDAAAGTDVPFDPRIHELRMHPGQRDCAAAYLELLHGSEIRESHRKCTKVQDPYSLRCQPQVMGACLDHMQFVAQMLQREVNAVSDNPLVFADTGQVLSGGNFHGEPIAMAADVLALVIAEIGALSERRTALLIDPHMSGLPPFLVAHGGLNSGFMLPQVTAAALASENKSLAHPACVDSLPTSANQEDHVSMSTFAARRLLEMVDNTANIVAIEVLAACQGIDLRRPLKTSPRLQTYHEAVRCHVSFYESDRPFTHDIEIVRSLIATGQLDFSRWADAVLVLANTAP